MTKKWKVTLENQETGKRTAKIIETQGEKSGFAEVKSEVVRKLKKNNTIDKWVMVDVERVK
jgi:hypothetical protein